MSARREWQAGDEQHIGPVKVKVPGHAGPGAYEVRVGLWDPKQHKRPGVILGGQGNAMVVGTLTIKSDGDKITDITYKPK